MPERRRLTGGLAAVLVACCGGVALAQGGGPALSLSGDTSQVGHIGLTVRGQPGATVTISENLGGGTYARLTQVQLSGDSAALPRAARWGCDRRTRAFVAQAQNPDGSQENASTVVNTPSCRRRLQARVKRRTRVGRRVRIRVADRWGIGGISMRVCTTPPGGRRSCRTAALPAGQKRLTPRFRARRVGGWRVRVQTRYQRVRRTVRARHKGGRIRVLATGDSMIQYVDSFLGRKLKPRRGRVRSDAHISTGISKGGFDWRRHARSSSRRRKQDVTVVFIGANDGFAMRTPSGARVECCGAAWSAEYGRRARTMMRAYTRKGRGRVYWLLLPQARGGFFARSFPAVNAGLKRAARGLESDVRLIRLNKVFTPGGRYRESITYRGRRIHARQGDGVHLSPQGASLAASIVVRAMRKERLVR